MFSVEQAKSTVRGAKERKWRDHFILHPDFVEPVCRNFSSTYRLPLGSYSLSISLKIWLGFAICSNLKKTDLVNDRFLLIFLTAIFVSRGDHILSFQALRLFDSVPTAEI